VMSAKTVPVEHTPRRPIHLWVWVTLFCLLTLVRCGAPAEVPPTQTNDTEQALTAEPGSQQASSEQASPTATWPEIKAMFEKGIRHYNTGQFDQAIAQFVAILEKDPSNLNARSNLGAAYFNTGKLNAALHEFEVANSQAPDDAEILYNLGAARLALGNINQALEAFEKAVEIAPTLPDVHIGLGTAYIMRGEQEAGVRELQRALELAPNAPWRTIVENQIKNARQSGEVTSLPPRLTPTAEPAPAGTK